MLKKDRHAKLIEVHGAVIVQQDDDESDVLNEFDRHQQKTIRVPMTLAIVSILFFWPIGIPALVFSVLADQHLRHRRYAEARHACEQARKYAIVSIVIPVVVIFVIVLALLKSR